MSAIYTWACFLLWISSATPQKSPDVVVTCFNSENCALPCTFQPGRNETVEWFRQDVLLYRFDRNSSKERFYPDQLAERASISPQQIADGNATLILRRSDPKDRGTYRCHVQTSGGGHKAKVILKVEAPIRGLFLEQSRLSGYEEIKCSVQDVFPPPRVTWVTEPPTFEDLRPVTRMHAKPNGLYSVDSRLRKLKSQPDLIYICKMTSSYGASTWTSSLREREAINPPSSSATTAGQVTASLRLMDPKHLEHSGSYICEFCVGNSKHIERNQVTINEPNEITGTEGKDLTIRCLAPTYLNNPTLYWTFSRGDKSTLILSYDSRSGHSFSLPSWVNHVELDAYKAAFGDGSLRLMDPKHSEHSGSYICEFSVGNSKHIERNQVTINEPNGQRSVSEEPSYWWILGVVAAVLVLAVAGLLAFLKLRGRVKKPRNHPEEETELNRVKDVEATQ